MEPFSSMSKCFITRFVISVQTLLFVVVCLFYHEIIILIKKCALSSGLETPFVVSFQSGRIQLIKCSGNVMSLCSYSSRPFLSVVFFVQYFSFHVERGVSLKTNTISPFFTGVCDVFRLLVLDVLFENSKTLSSICSKYLAVVVSSETVFDCLECFSGL